VRRSRGARDGFVRRPPVGEAGRAGVRAGRLPRGQTRGRGRDGRRPNACAFVRSGEKPSRTGVDGRGADPERGAASHAEALERLAAHIANPAKFKRASALAAELMRSGELERRHGKSVFALLDAAMTPPSRAADPRTRFEYRDLFAAAERCADEGVLNAKHAKRLRGVFLVYVNLVNRAFTDDAFEFARFAKDVADRFDALPPYEPEPVAPEEPDHVEDVAVGEASAYDVHGNAPSSGASEARATALRMRRAESPPRGKIGASSTRRATRCSSPSRARARDTASRGRRAPWTC